MLSDALASLVDQGLPHDDYEIVIVDDASPTSLSDVANAYGDRLRIAYHRAEQNAGHLASFARAFELASAPLVSFLSHDDVVAPGQLGRAAAMFEQPDTVLVASLALCQRYPGAIETRLHGMFLRGAAAPRFDRPYTWDATEWLALALISTPLALTGSVFRADAFRQCREWPAFPLWHDRLMLAEMGLHGRVVSLPWIGGHYRISDGQLSGQLWQDDNTEFRGTSDVILRLAMSARRPVIEFWIDHLCKAPEAERNIYLRLLNTALAPAQFAALRRACEKRLGKRLPLTRLERLRVPRAIADAGARPGSRAGRERSLMVRATPRSLRFRLSGLLKSVVFGVYGLPFSRFGLDPGLVPFLPPGEPITLVDVGAASGDFTADGRRPLRHPARVAGRTPAGALPRPDGALRRPAIRRPASRGVGRGGRCRSRHPELRRQFLDAAADSRRR